jgi:hypothetical protein
MPRFYFHLTSKDSRIPDESGKELNTLNDAYVDARNLIDNVLFHVGYVAYPVDSGWSTYSIGAWGAHAH